MEKEHKEDYDIEHLMKKKFTKIKKNKKKWKLKKGLGNFIMFFFVVIAGILLVLTPTITLKGKEEMILEYPMEYKEPGYVSKIITKDISKNVVTNGKVNSKKVGEYEITYSVQKWFLKQKVTRTIKVVDKEKPIIDLKGSKETKVCPGKEYLEEGYEAIDNYDENLTDKVNVLKKENEWIYSVQDSNGNQKIKKRKFQFVDDQMPTIELTNSGDMYLNEGSTFVEPGYKAYDNCDGDITDKVEVTGSVDTKKAGTYELVYTALDSAQNKAEVKRKVIVQRKVASSMSCGEPGTIYLTFDDGPQNGTTDKILNILKEEGVSATFFVTNNGPDSLILRMHNEGHALALHTSSHNYSYIYSSMDNYFADLSKVSNRVKNITGVDTKIIRFPGGSSNTISRNYQRGIMSALTREVIDRGYRYYDWNVDSNDAGACAKTGSSSCVYNHVTQNLSKSRCNMILMHDIKSYTAAALRDIIQYGKNNGYTFKKIDSSTPMVRQQVNN